MARSCGWGLISDVSEMGEGLRGREPLFDPEQMRAALARHLRWGDGRTVEVYSCDVTYHRQASGRTLLHYDVVVCDPATGGERRELVTGIVSDQARIARRWEEIGEQRPLATPDRLTPVAMIAELGLLIQVYPFDVRLPAIVQLLTDPAPLVSSHILTDLSPEEQRTTIWHAETVRYRVDMRAMILLTARINAGHAERESVRRVYAKVFRDDEDGQRSFHVQRALWEAVVAQEIPLAIARPIAYLPEARTFLFDEVAGASFRSILDSGAPSESIVRNAARAIAAFHQLPIDAMLAYPRRRATRDEAIRLAKLGSDLRTSQPQLGSQIEQVIAEIGARLTNAPVAVTHFDLRPDHILIDGSHVALIDFDKISLAEPMVDVANLLSLLGKDWESTRVHGGQRQRAPEIFKEEYFAHVPIGWSDRLPAHYALALLSQAAKIGKGARDRAASARKSAAAAELIQQALLTLNENHGS